MVNTDKSTPTFKTVERDLLNVKMYTLRNGLRLFLSVNKSEPRIHTNIVVRAGSKNDPPETTGLAHYMEHMLFKGTSRIGSTDWEKEEEYLQQIADLYEKHRSTSDETVRKDIYAEIDRLSFEAAKLVAPNEYDRLASDIGAKGTNAYTWVEQTVFTDDIPSNELERWMMLESERFRMMALRLFHTELETVYEEFNINQDRDFRKVFRDMRGELFPTHPYGTQTTIGTAEDLRNPSMKNIQDFFQRYYVPNNMGLVLAGDFDPDQVVTLAEKYFGHFEAQEVPPFTFEEQPPIKGPVRRHVKGKEAPFLTISWRFGGSHTDEALMITLLQQLLFNQRAGLLDLHLNQQQKVLASQAWAWYHEDYSTFGLYGQPRENQQLQEVEQLLLEQIDRLKAGDFPDWLIDACVKDFKLNEIKSMEDNKARVAAMTQAFVLGVDWERFTHRIEWMEGVSKQQIVDFAREHLDDSHVVVYKEQGEDPDVIKVEKPPITSVELNRDNSSEFARHFLATRAPRLQPEFVDFSQRIARHQLPNGVQLDYVHNPDNELFRLNYIFDMGKKADRKLPLALLYLPYLGTDQYSPSELQQAFFRLGLQFEVHSKEDRSYVTLEGLEESLQEGLRLFEHLLQHVRANDEALQNVIADVLTRRSNHKQDRNFILRNAFTNYAKYGPESPFTYRLNEEELRQLQSQELVGKIRSLANYEHRIYYFGGRPAEEVLSLLQEEHRIPEQLQPLPAARTFEQRDTQENVVYFLDFPIVQTDLMLVSRRSSSFRLEEHIMRGWYNAYFGMGLSSIIFQEIREARALAYATFAAYTSPSRADEGHFLQAYIGTQPDKVDIALPALYDLIENMPIYEGQIEQARQSILQRIETERILPRDLYWSYLATKDRGYEQDLRRDIYERLQNATKDDLLQFHEQHVRGASFNLLVMGSKDRLDMDYLGQFGRVEEVRMEDIFGY